MAVDIPPPDGVDELCRLPEPNQRVVTLLLSCEGWDYTSVGKLLNLDWGQVRDIRAEAQEQIREVLEPYRPLTCEEAILRATADKPLRGYPLLNAVRPLVGKVMSAATMRKSLHRLITSGQVEVTPDGYRAVPR